MKLNNKTILCVEDNPANMRLVEKIINRCEGLNLIKADNAELGLEIAKHQLPDLILMDIMLPGMNGFEAKKVLQNDSATKNIPVIALSANAMKSDLQQGKEVGFIDYLTKPIDVKILLEKIEQQLGVRTRD